ncbi:hypothetical protein [Clostridium sp. JN-1]|uniref:hypothetical protein n=1 Tax=Clostridium sp. JN-1 TaxID=2483110 RepID=UPI000F0B3E6C|nr:hypothetical protein [Clostridium sp. JN-1]
MKKKLTNWILNNLNKQELINIVEKNDIMIPGFRKGNLKNALKVTIQGELKDRNDLLDILRTGINTSEEKDEFENKSIDEVKNLINTGDKKKFLRQITFLAASEKAEYNDLANNLIGEDGEIVDKVENNNSDQEYDKYVVEVKYENDRFYNLYPLCKIYKHKFETIDGYKEYPNYGNIAVNPNRIFSEKNYDIEKLLICKFNPDDLEDYNDKTKKKIDGDKLINNNNIYSLSDEKIYEIAEVGKNIDLSKKIYDDEVIVIQNEPIKNEVYIKDNKYIYGPFGYKSRSTGGGYYIDRSKNDYIVKRYPIKENENCLNIQEIDNLYDKEIAYIKVVYFYDSVNLVFDEIDTISDKELLDELKRIINTKNMSCNKSELQNIRKNIISIVNNSLSKERIKRITKLISETEVTENFIEKDLLDIIKLFLNDDSTKEKIIQAILKDNCILEKLQNSKLVMSELENAKKELDDINSTIKDSKNINEKNLSKNFRLDIKKLIEEKENIEKDIEELKEKYNLCTEIDELIKKKEKIDEEVNKANGVKEYINKDIQKNKEENHKLQNEAEEIQRSLEKELENIMNAYNNKNKNANIIFEGFAESEMLKAADKWNKKRNSEDFKDKVASRDNFKLLNIKSFKNENIVDYIYNKVKKVRNYSKNDVINIMICLTQGFLTIFAGQPGVGKTSLCNIIARVLGLYRKDEFNRYTEVSVEKGWTSKRDLIGYYNPLTKSFDKNNGMLFSVFNILNYEYKKNINDFPYFILLDEANLSPMEYYWADFMNVCDIDKDDRRINLGEDYIYNIPKTLRFLATINYDHTTEVLSPRLIDRAWIVLLDYSYDDNILYDEDSNVEENDEIVTFEDIEKYFLDNFKNNGIPASIIESLDEICREFNKNNICVSPRIRKIINMYLKTGVNIFESSKNTSREYAALDYAVAQKLLPKINGQGEKYEEFLKNLMNLFKDKNMTKCVVILKRIIENGNNNMQYYQFFS